MNGYLTISVKQARERSRSFERTLGLSRAFGRNSTASLLWPTISLNVILGLYFVERWLLRPRVAELFGRDESRNFGVPDVYVLVYFSALFLSSWGRASIVRTLRFFSPMLALYGVGGSLTVFFDAGLANADYLRSFWAFGHIFFCFLVLGPVLLDATERIGFSRAFLCYAAWIGIAGILSVTDRIGVTNLGNQEFYRLENVLLGVNGFYVVGLLVPILLFLLTRALGRNQYLFAGFIVAILLFSHLGLALAGVRTGLILAGLGWSTGIWVCLRYGELHRVKASGYFVAALFAAALAGFVVGTSAGREMVSLDVFIMRAEATQGMFADDDRFFVYNLAWSDLIHKGAWLLGNGVNQWVIVHTNTEVVHNVFLLAWWEGGLLGLAGWVLMYLRPYVLLSFSALERGGTSANRGMTWGAGFCIIGTAIGGLAYPIGYSRGDWLWFIIAVTPVLLHRNVRDTSTRHIDL
jgi:hypothetical protein